MTIMKKVVIAAGIVSVSCFGALNSAYAKDKLDKSNDKAKLGYVFGAQMGNQLVGSGLLDEIDMESVFMAFRDAAKGGDLQLTQEEMQQVQIAFQEKQQAKANELANENQALGDAFLAKNAKQKGVKTTESGLQYKVIREGKGKLPVATDTVQVHYSGKLIDGTEFDSSYTRGAPADFPVSGVIPGFSEGLQLMKEGAKYSFTIPAGQAYGVQGPPSIGPNQVLIFDVELIAVK